MSAERNRSRDAQHAPRRPETKAGPKGAALGLIVVGLVAAIGLGGAIWWETRAASTGAGVDNATAIGGPFRMVDQDGRAVDQSLLKGKWSAVFFGYTFCPDICPLTLQNLGVAATRLRGKARDLQIVFVSVDSGRDHPKEMRAYLDAQNLPVKTIGLTGSPEQLAAMAKAYRVYYAKSGTGADYSMDHSAAVYLMNPEGRFAAPLSGDMKPDQIAVEIAKAEGRS